MPRGSRIDAAGAVQHIMVYGIERAKIFKRDTDGDLFVQRLSDILDDTKTACYAWSLMPNHFHQSWSGKFGQVHKWGSCSIVDVRRKEI